MSSAATKADTVIRNANVITMDRDRPHAQAVAMSNGRIIGLGSNQDVETFVGPNVKVMDLTGSTVLPGFIDAHIHVLNSGIRHVMAADCDLPSISAIQTALRERVETTAPGQWVQGFKYDDTKTAENRSIFREELDAVSTFHPIMVSHRAGAHLLPQQHGARTRGVHTRHPGPLRRPLRPGPGHRRAERSGLRAGY